MEDSLEIPETCSCGAPALGEHECPYAAEIGGKTIMCNCCDECWGQCADDI